jgi:hypothetical protein
LQSGSASTRRRGPGLETLRIVTKDQVRTLRVPNKETQPGNLVLAWSDYVRVRENAVVQTQAERQAQELLLETQHDHVAQASRSRRKQFEEFDVTRKTNEPPSQLDLDTAKKEQSMLANARELLAEQDDEIKKINELILEAKVHAVLDAQVSEKREIKQHEAEHDYRLDLMMEEERVRGLLEAERIERSLKEEHMQGRRELEAQIEERELQGLLGNEIREQEQKAMLEKLELLHLEDYESAQQKRDEARALMADVSRANQEAIRIRQTREAAAQLEDAKLAEFLAMKAEREQELEEEGLRKKAAWERQQARMIESQDAQSSLQEERDGLAERRAHAERERKARAQAVIDARNKAAAREELLAGLNTQLESRAHERARVAEDDYKEFHTNLKALEDVIITEKTTESESHARRVANKEGVIEQIKEKEREAIMERVNFFEEGSELGKEAAERAARIAEIKERKLEALRMSGIDPSHLVQVERAVEINNRRRNKVTGAVV